MKYKKIKKSFFNRPTLTVAKDLLGKFLVRRYRGRNIVGQITETEAYIGPQDRASHAFGGKKTQRNAAEYMEGGHIYIYLVYGKHWQFNISTAAEGKPECVLIRAVHPFSQSAGSKKSFLSGNKELENKNLTNGPGKLCRYFKFDKSFYAEDICRSKRIWLEDRGYRRRNSRIYPPLSRQAETGRNYFSVFRQRKIKAGPRIGINYAGSYWAKKPWRFWI